MVTRHKNGNFSRTWWTSCPTWCLDAWEWAGAAPRAQRGLRISIHGDCRLDKVQSSPIWIQIWSSTCFEQVDDLQRLLSSHIMILLFINFFKFYFQSSLRKLARERHSDVDKQGCSELHLEVVEGKVVRCDKHLHSSLLVVILAFFCPALNFPVD